MHNQIYLNPNINQQKSEKKIPLGTVSRPFLCGKAHVKLSSYTSSLRGFGKLIFDYLFRKRNYKNVCLKNKTIATAIGCSVRTVQRWTDDFIKEGYLIKMQEHTFAVNQYYVTPEARQAYQYGINLLTAAQQDLIMTHGHYTYRIRKKSLHPETVILYKSYNNNKYLYNNPIPRIRARVKNGDLINIAIRKENYHTGVSLMKQTSKDLIRSLKNEPSMKMILERPEIKPLIITPQIQEIARCMKFTDREQLKLIAFPTEVLDHGYDKACGCNRSKLRDPLGWFISVCTNYCKQHNIEPDWRWYYELCEILGMEPMVVTDNKKVMLKNPSHNPFVIKPIVRTLEEECAFLRDEIASCQYALAEIDTNRFLRISKPAFERRLQDALNRLHLLEAKGAVS